MAERTTKGDAGMIKLCKEHLLELQIKWGGHDKIVDAYGEVVITEPKFCENFTCVFTYRPETIYRRGL